MRIAQWLLVACVAVAGRAMAAESDKPLLLQDSERIFDNEPGQVAPDQTGNNGGVNIELTVSYFNDFIYRGVSRDKLLTGKTGPDMQADLSLSFDLGKYPHPFVGIFSNVFNGDPVSRYQEIRPYFGADWKLRPLIITGGYNAYLFPNRDPQNTNEVFGRVTLMDEVIFNTDEPILSPYVYGAYDYDLYNGWYLEAGVKHDFRIEGTSLTLTFLADVAYVIGLEQYRLNGKSDTGFQHYDVGLIGRYSLNSLLNVPRRLGRWSINGYLYYTDGIDNHLRSTTGVWGGGGIEFSY